MNKLYKIILDWLDVNVQRKHKNSLLFLAMSFYLTLKGTMQSYEFIGVGLTTLGIYVVSNVVDKKNNNSVDNKVDKGADNDK